MTLNVVTSMKWLCKNWEQLINWIVATGWNNSKPIKTNGSSIDIRVEDNIVVLLTSLAQTLNFTHPNYRIPPQSVTHAYWKNVEQTFWTQTQNRLAFWISWSRQDNNMKIIFSSNDSERCLRSARLSKEQTRITRLAIHIPDRSLDQSA